jgi:hypothetical protein
MKEASFYEKRPDGKVHCALCRHHCIIAINKRGLCGVRENREGILYTLVYELPCATHVDPIEKKPLFPVQKPFLSRRWAVISIVSIVKTTIYPRCPGNSVL